jgi:hypothetical protein
MTTDRTRRYIQKIALAVLFTAAGMFVAWPACAVVKPGAKFAGGNLTLEAKNATVGELLETLARTVGVDVFVARGFQTAGNQITLQIAGVPIEEAIRSILRGYSYAAIYVKEGDEFRIAALKIYPEGQPGGEVVPLFSGGRTAVYEEKNRRGETVAVMVSSGGEVITHGGLERKGLLVPSQSIPNPAGDPAATLNKPWFALQLQLESQEAAQYQNLMLLQKRLDSATDPDLKKSLTMIYADEVAKFHTAKRANLSKVESLKRITQFREMTGQ